jgi:hypothetical protein
MTRENVSARPRVWLLVAWSAVYIIAATLLLTQSHSSIPQQRLMSNVPPSFDFFIVTPYGDIRVRLFTAQTPNATTFLRAILAVTSMPTASLLVPCNNCRFYRAEPVPAYWGSPSLPDSSFGGRWGPPYALLQGQFGGSGPKALVPIPSSDKGPSAMIPLKRGMIAWAGAPHFFISLAHHPEWKLSHVVSGIHILFVCLFV